MTRRGLALVVVVLMPFLGGCFGEPEDDDVLTRDVEEQGYTITIRLLDGTNDTRRVTSSPFHEDEDRDGLDDMQERLEGTDPRDPDTDGDGLLDGERVYLDRGDRRARVWQERGIIHEPTDEGFMFQGEHGNGGNPKHQDTDADGLTDGEEVGGFVVTVDGEDRPVVTLAYAPDTDGDALLDGFEREHGLDPSRADTDGDGAVDFADVDPYHDVLVLFRTHLIRLEEQAGDDGDEILYVLVQSAASQYRSDSLEVPRGENVRPSVWDRTLDPDDGGGDFRRRQHNITFAITVVRQPSATRSEPVDVFSSTTGSKTLVGRLQAMTGQLYLGSDGGAPWPSEGRFTGVEGTVDISLAIQNPAR